MDTKHSTLLMFLCVLGVLCGGRAALVQAQVEMPDPKQMSGIPRPVGPDELPNGSVSVRLIRGELTNRITDHPVQMRINDKTVTVNTDQEGRAQFDHLPAGAKLQASTDVDG